MTRVITIDMGRDCTDCGEKGAAENGRCLRCIGESLGVSEATGDSLDTTMHEVTVKLSAAELVSLRKAFAAIESMLDETFILEGFTTTLKFKTPFPVAGQVRAIKELFRSHRGVKADVKSVATTKDLCSIDSESPDWKDTPMGQILPDM